MNNDAFINCKPSIEAWHVSLSKKKFSPSIINSLHDAHVDSAPWKDRYPFLSKALHALESEEERPVEIRSGNLRKLYDRAGAGVLHALGSVQQVGVECLG